MIEIEELWRRIDENVRPRETEILSLSMAVGRCLSEDIFTTEDMPPFDHSAMDGYAFSERKPGICKVIETIAAGSIPHQRVQAGQATRIFTGAPIPEGTFAVVRQEDCEADGDCVRVAPDKEFSEGSNIRRRGGIRSAGEVLLEKGTVLNPGAVAWCASSGTTCLPVYRRPRVLQLVTGSELLSPGEAASLGKIADSNGPMISALLSDSGISSDRQLIADDAQWLSRLVGEFDGDLLLISGGSGPGDHDHSLKILKDAGYTVHASSVNSRPGKPLIFATSGERVAFGLPGNPLSHWVCYQVFIHRALDRMLGRKVREWVEVYCSEWKDDRGDGRRTWMPARLEIREGRADALPLPWLHSGDLSPLLKADVLLLDGRDPPTQRVPALLI